MSKRIAHVVYKYPTEQSILSGEHEVVVPAGEVVHVAAQRPSDPLPTIWVQHVVHWDEADSGSPQISAAGRLRIAVIGTGHTFTGNGRHVGSAVCANGNLVWHAYATEEG